MKTLRALLLASTVLCTASPALAASFEYYGSNTAIYGELPSMEAKIIHVPRAIFGRRNQDDRDQQWSDYCEPGLRTDAYGVDHYTYKHPGCEYGKSSDDD